MCVCVRQYLNFPFIATSAPSICLCFGYAERSIIYNCKNGNADVFHRFCSVYEACAHVFTLSYHSPICLFSQEQVTDTLCRPFRTPLKLNRLSGCLYSSITVMGSSLYRTFARVKFSWAPTDVLQRVRKVITTFY